MALDFRALTIHFDPTKGQVQKESATAVFDRDIAKANAALQSFSVSFTNGDRPLFREAIDIHVDRILHDTVTVSVSFLLRDHSGHIDDTFQGSVTVLVIADLKD